MAIGALGMTSCSSSTTSSPTSTAGGGTNASNGSGPIVVGGVWSQGDYTGADVGAQAAFNAFNAAGGLGGRKIKFIGMQEDGSSETQDVAAAKALVNAHVMAVVPVMTQAWVAGKVLQQAGIPYFGWGISTSWWGSNNGFSYVGANPPSPSLEKNVVSTPGLFCRIISGGCAGKTVALVSINNAAAINTIDVSAAEWRTAGAKVVEQLTSIPSPPAVVSDFTPYIDQLLSSNNGKAPDIIQQILPPTNDIAVISQLNHLGYKGHDFSYSLYDPRAASVAKGSNVLVTSAPWEEQSPAVQTMKQQVQALNPNVILGQPTEAGYWSAQLFIAALKHAGPSVTSASLIKSLNSGFTFSIPGGTGPVTYPAAHMAGGGCQAIVSSDGSKYSVVLPLTCGTPIKNPLYKP
jgi:ABC-type branched-subunit amino acid transport system substrate-binding protein